MADHTQLSSQLLAENIIEVEVDFNEKVSKNLHKTGIPDVLDAEFALCNTNGGIIKLKTSLSPERWIKKIDDWQLNLNVKRQERLKTLGQKETLAEIIDYRLEDLRIFVKKSSIILTEKSNLYVRRGSQKYELQSFFEIQNLFLKNNNPECYCKSEPPIEAFTRGQQMPFGEGVNVEYKELTSRNLEDKLLQESSEYVTQFANTNGGSVYFGISDNGIIKGQHVNDQEMRDIKCNVKYCMESKIWINNVGERDTPKHYKVTFSRVKGADEHTFVIQVHICHYAGAVFRKEPECRVIDDNNQICNMSFEKWLSSFLKSVRAAEGNSNYQEDRFDKRKRGTFTYFSVKKTVQKLVKDLTSASPEELHVHPSHAVRWIEHPALDIFVDLTRKVFKENNWQSGIAYIERCWEVNLGLSSTKPDNVICDILVCCPQMPLVFVTLTKSDTSDEASAYNKKVAARLKNTLVQEADCLDKFYVKPVVISRWQLEVEDGSRIYSEIPLYPKAYRMTNNKYSNILQALVLVLARSNAMSSHRVGQALFNLLTYEQYNILHESYEESPKVKITGPPGSGKTVLALERIHRLRNEGSLREEVLFLCSNKPLKARVENMKTHDGHSLCIVKTYYEVATLAKSNVILHVLGNIKHILADEAQNFQESDTSLDWWLKLHALCDAREDSSFWVFFDNAQKINNKRSVSLWRFSKKELKTVIRQTGNVHGFITSKYMRVDPQVELGHNFDGPKVDVLVPFAANPTESYLVYILISRLHNLIVKDGHHMNDITVLFNDFKQKELYESLFVQHTDNSCPVRNGEDVKEHGVVFDTIRRYCGLDDNIIIGFCPEYYPSGFQDNHALMTTLCSRTKLKLILILENAEIAKCFHLAPTELKYIKVRNIREVINFPRQ